MRARRLITLFLLAWSVALSCTKEGDFSFGPGRGSTSPASPRGGIPEGSFDKVFLMVSGGHNDLTRYITEDQRDMEQNWLPGGTPEDKDVLVFLSRVNRTSGFANVESPVMYRMFRKADGTVQRDTLHRWGEDDRLFKDGRVLHDALAMIRRRFPAKSYGLVVSSHGTGWLPPRYYFNPSKYESGSFSAPGKRSIGDDTDGDVTYEMPLMDFIAAIPYKLDYALIDCCLCGGVEVAWGLRGKADFVGFSQTEILADGFDYKKVVQRLLGGAVPDVEAVCQDYFAQYGASGSATISLVDTREMDDLASVCATLFDKYRAALAALDGGMDDDWESPSYGYYKVQGYFRYERHYFYDLEDILLKAGITEEEHAQLTAALNRCVLYKAHSNWFMRGSWYGFPINIHSGFSMYLPSMGTELLNNYYINNIAWNQATHLVQ